MKYVVAALSTAFVAALLFAAPPPAQADEFEFIGARSCGKCHRKEKDGEQYGIWQESGHAKAFEALGTDDAKKAAQEVGVSGDPQKQEACLVCHTTGYGADEDRFSRRFKMENGVQCEACHGAGEEYKSKRTMKKISEERGPDGTGDSPTAKKTGLIFPDENTCKRCHTQQIEFNGKTYKNPRYEEFNFDERWDQIKHPIPES